MRVSRQWLLFEVLGAEPVLVAHGYQLRKMIPVSSFLARSPKMNTITQAIADTVQRQEGLVVLSSDGRELIMTEPVTMTDGVMHGVHVWSGKSNARPPTRPVPGAVIWDLTAGVATDSGQALLNSGKDPASEPAYGRMFAADMPVNRFHPEESEVLTLSVSCKPGDTFCSTWDIVGDRGEPIRASFVARARREMHPDGTVHLISRAMNWQVPSEPKKTHVDDLAGKILRGMEQDGVHRALADLKTWNLLKWLDTPNPHFDWRGREISRPLIHPDDVGLFPAIIEALAKGSASAVLRFRSERGGWTPIHSTVYRVELASGIYAALVLTRLPTPNELARLSARVAHNHTTANARTS